MTLTRKDFMSDQTIRWCPGCGDYSILSQLQNTLADLALEPENVAVVSGIGCSSRLPYYMSTYGFHTIHGRAPAVATGLKITNPDLSVWVITGDGDGLSIGGNHLAHVLRRNVDLNLILFNNRIYGLTKGQYSPTSEVGKRTKSSPMGSPDNPLNPAAFALGSGATHVARSVDIFPKHLRKSMADCHHHRGTAFLEVMQNCNIFNDGAFADYTGRKQRKDRVLYLEPGEPLVWGETETYGLVQRGFALEIARLGDGLGEDDCVRHDPTDRALAWALATLDDPDTPLVLGTIFQVETGTYEGRVRDQLDEAREKLGAGDIDRLLRSGESFVMR